MATVNKAILIGKLTNEVQLREAPSGSTVSNFKLEVIESYLNKSGDRQETTTLVDIEVWGVQAENCAKYLSKGREVLVEGRLKLDKWQDQEGNNRSRLLVRARSVTFLDAPPAKKEMPEPIGLPMGSPPEKEEKPYEPPNWDDFEEPPF